VRVQGTDARVEALQTRLAELATSLHELDQRRELTVAELENSRSRAGARTLVGDLRTQLAEALAELDGLHTAMVNRGVIERAKGMLMVRLAIDEQAAFEYLRAASNRLNRRVAEIAAEIVETRAGGVG
jgi:hypothetical protein